MDTALPFPPTDTRLSRLDPRAVAAADLVLCDLDGCLVSEGRAFPEAADFIAACGVRLWVVSNCSDQTAGGIAARLAAMGLAVPAERILLAGEIALEHLARQEGIRRLALYAAPPLHARARALGLDPDADAARPEAVLLCRDPAVTVHNMGRILAQVAAGARLWVANEDMSHPGHDAQPVAETGALLAALRAIRPDLRWSSLGKPAPWMLEVALERTGLDAGGAVFVGDNIDTDGRAAADVGIPFIHIHREPAR